jgi:exodeoxyribonuclease-3
MKLISWNVNGLRACLGKGFTDFFNAADADIFCLQETKMERGQADIDFPGYEEYWNSAVKKGYSGTAIFTRIPPLSVRYGLGIPRHDQEGRVITLEFPDFFLVNVYTPNAQRGLERLDYRMEWEDDFGDYLQVLDAQKPVILCGDLNVAHREIDLKNPKTNRRNAGFTDEERAKMTKLLEAGFVDTFRHLYPDKEGAYTWWSYMFNARANNAGWRIDYFIVSRRLAEQVEDSLIHDGVLGSDHCPVELRIRPA